MPSILRPLLSTALIAASPALAAPSLDLAKVSVRPAALHAVKLVMVGDTGAPASEGGCAARADGSVPPGEACTASAAQRAALRDAIANEHADAIFAVGDLVYPRMPACDGEVDAHADTLAAAFDLFTGPSDPARAPTFLVLGNHDIGQLRGRSPRRERCALALAAKTPPLRMPALQYEVDVGFGKIIVLDSNLRDQTQLPAAAIREAMDNPLSPWTLVVSHHELRTGWDKELDGFWEPPPPGRWLVDAGLRPDLWINGHAHSMQFGVYDARVADTGRAPADAPTAPVWVPALTTGARLYCWTRTKDDPQGAPCGVDPKPAAASVSN